VTDGASRAHGNAEFGGAEGHRRRTEALESAEFVESQAGQRAVCMGLVGRAQGCLLREREGGGGRGNGYIPCAIVGAGVGAASCGCGRARICAGTAGREGG